MAYTTNPNIPKVRRQAVNKVQLEGWSMRQAARHFGVSHSSVVRWCGRAPEDGRRNIETLSCRPMTSPREIDQHIVDRIVALRLQTGRCAEVIHSHLEREGVVVSLSTIKRYLDKHGLRKKKSKWKKYHRSGARPKPENPGKLVQMDSIHIMKRSTGKERIYIVTLIDVHSRWAYANAYARINTQVALQTFRRAAKHAPFAFSCIQSDHGPEFTKYFTTMVEAQGTQHRHSRVRKPNDNAHVERFNRTIQEEMSEEIRRYRTNMSRMNRSINEYIHYYNHERLHLGIDLKTPVEML
ncbi:MAG: DDE-type integrase/transposase/recombinase [Candidatus Kerfeldbacteria bacterium]